MQKWKLSTDRKFKPTSNARNEAMFKEASKFASHLRTVEKDLLKMHKEVEGAQCAKAMFCCPSLAYCTAHLFLSPPALRSLLVHAEYAFQFHFLHSCSTIHRPDLALNHLLPPCYSPTSFCQVFHTSIGESRRMTPGNQNPFHQTVIQSNAMPRLLFFIDILLQPP